MLRILSVLCLFLSCSIAFAQETFPVNGVGDERPGVYAFTNASIYRDYQTRIENATMVIKNGRVVNVGQGIAIPTGAIVQDLAGKTVYPGLVDIYSHYGLPDVERKSYSYFAAPQLETKKEGPFAWNQTIRAETDAIDHFKTDAKYAEKWRKNGFTAALTHVKDGIARGTSALVTLQDDAEQNVIVNDRASAHYSFDRGSSGQLYPTSIMGSAALLRQTYYDASWYASSTDRTINNQSLQAFTALQGLPQIFDASTKLNVLLADKVGDEFGVQYIIKGGGDEYQRVDEIRSTGARLIIPINYPEGYDTSDPLSSLDISLADLKHWEMASANPGILEQAGIDFAITPDGLKATTFWKNLRRAVANGLSESVALKSLTYTPAVMVNAQGEIGTLNPGSRANFFVASGNMLSDNTASISETWVAGERYVVKSEEQILFSGKYDMNVRDLELKLQVNDGGGKLATLMAQDSTKIKVKAAIEGGIINLSFEAPGKYGTIRLTGWKSGRDIKGNGQWVDGSWVNWRATYLDQSGNSGRAIEQKGDSTMGKTIYPFVAFGNTELPVARDYIIRNATVWTNESQGIVKGADVLVRNGKIAEVGTDLSAEGVTEIDGTGKHLTSGIIDEHSHVGLRGVNESSHAITAEVRMYDALDSEDIDIYRQLAGGVTAAQLLHGSANPIGGQSALVKFRWGQSPEGMKIKGADGYIKFALGENVKHGNRPRVHNVRYPQTRMGVEQVFVDAFTRARAYDTQWREYNNLAPKKQARAQKPRRDIQLETLAEILNKERFISCHSYVQSEINMLMKVAERFDFRIATFTHILEGYKVADKMSEHGVGGSTFADWWAYKWEVKEAIPHNAALMNMVGVVTAINSDDGEMARRLNQEAAKSVKYAGMPEEEAWKMVTLNPAKLLHLDERMGSIRAGKDADLVLWSDHPLSIYAKAEITMIDGVIYYELKRDTMVRKALANERARIISKMQASGNGGGKKAIPRPQKDFHCEDTGISNDYRLYRD